MEHAIAESGYARVRLLDHKTGWQLEINASASAIHV